MGKAAKGTVIGIATTTTGVTFTNVAEVRDIAGGGFTVDTVDLTHHGSDVEEIAPTIVRTQELTFQLNWNPRAVTHGATGFTSVRKAVLDRAKRRVRLSTPAATSTAADHLIMNGYFIGLNNSQAVADGLFADVTFKPIGATFADYTTAAALP
jgi:hypothetical protein